MASREEPERQPGRGHRARRSASFRAGRDTAFRQAAFLAVTDQELALVKLRPKKVVMLKAAEVIARVPRSQLQTAELFPGYVAPFAITFAGGGTWRLEVPPPSKRYARPAGSSLSSEQGPIL